MLKNAIDELNPEKDMIIRKFCKKLRILEKKKYFLLQNFLFLNLILYSENI